MKYIGYFANTLSFIGIFFVLGIVGTAYHHVATMKPQIIVKSELLIVEVEKQVVVIQERIKVVEVVKEVVVIKEVNTARSYEKIMILAVTRNGKVLRIEEGDMDKSFIYIVTIKYNVNLNHPNTIKVSVPFGSGKASFDIGVSSDDYAVTIRSVGDSSDGELPEKKKDDSDEDETEEF